MVDIYFFTFFWMSKCVRGRGKSESCLKNSNEELTKICLSLLSSSDKKDHIIMDNGTMMNEYGVPMKRQRITPPLSERVMLYVRQDNEDVYTPLHVVPPTTHGLATAVS